MACCFGQKVFKSTLIKEEAKQNAEKLVANIN